MHPLEVIFKKAVDQVASGKGNERHGDGGDFMIQPWVNITKLHGRGFLTGQAQKKLEEAVRKRVGHNYDWYERELLGAINYLAMALLAEYEIGKETTEELH